QRVHGGRPRAGTAEQLIAVHARRNQRQDRSGERPRRRLAGHGIRIGRRGLGRQRDRRRAGREQAGDLALDIMRELAGAGLGEIDAVIGAELADLAFEVGALLQEKAALVHEAVPDIDIGDAGLAGGFAIERIQEQHVRGALRTADRGKADPDYRYALGFDDRNHLLDLLRVELDPAIVAEFVKAVRRTRRLFRRRGGRRIGTVGVIELGVGRLVVGLGLGLALRLGVRSLVVGRLVVGRLVGRLAAGVLFRVLPVRRFFLVFVLVALFGCR